MTLGLVFNLSPACPKPSVVVTRVPAPRSSRARRRLIVFLPFIACRIEVISQKEVSGRKAQQDGEHLRQYLSKAFALSAPEYQPRRMLIDVFDRLFQLGKGTAAIDGEGLELLEAGIGKAREPGGDLVRAPVEIFRKLADRVGRLGRSHRGWRRRR